MILFSRHAVSALSAVESAKLGEGRESVEKREVESFERKEVEDRADKDVLL
jgi:hypothetical protein